MGLEFNYSFLQSKIRNMVREHNKTWILCFVLYVAKNIKHIEWKHVDVTKAFMINSVNSVATLEEFPDSISSHTSIV